MCSCQEAAWMTSYSCFLSVAMMRHLIKKHHKGRKGLFSPQFQVILHHLEEVKAAIHVISHPPSREEE